MCPGIVWRSVSHCNMIGISSVWMFILNHILILFLHTGLSDSASSSIRLSAALGIPALQVSQSAMLIHLTTCPETI